MMEITSDNHNAIMVRRMILIMMMMMMPVAMERWR